MKDQINGHLISLRHLTYNEPTGALAASYRPIVLVALPLLHWPPYFCHLCMSTICMDATFLEVVYD